MIAECPPVAVITRVKVLKRTRWLCSVIAPGCAIPNE